MIVLGNSDISTPTPRVEGWTIGETRQIYSAKELIEGDGVYINRNIQKSVLSSQYPEFYAIAAGVSPTPLFVRRVISGLTKLKGVAYDGSATAVVAGGDSIFVSSDGAATYKKASTPLVADFGAPHFFSGRFFVPYQNGTMISDVGAANFTPMPSDKASGMTPESIMASNSETLVIQSEQGLFFLKKGELEWRRCNGITISNIVEKSLVTNGSIFVVTGKDSYAYLSEDGQNWRRGALFKVDNPMGHIVYGGGYWLRGGSIKVDGGRVGSGTKTSSGILVCASKSASDQAMVISRRYTIKADDSYVTNMDQMGSNQYFAFAGDINGNISGFSQGWAGSGVMALPKPSTTSYKMITDVEFLRVLNEPGYYPKDVQQPYAIGEGTFTSNGAVFIKKGEDSMDCRVASAPPEITLPAFPASNVNSLGNYFTRIK